MDFSTVKYSTVLEKQEYPYLKSVVNKLGAIIKNRENDLNKQEIELEKQLCIVDRETGDDKKNAVTIYNHILSKIEDIVESINLQISQFCNPYFGKIVFREKSGKSFTAYLGKVGMLDSESKVQMIVDWRSPIANLYYKNSGPKNNVSYLLPLGERYGNLVQKRMFEIANSRFIEIYDTKSGNKAADQFLLSQLSKKVGQKLTDIVSTIQNQQNEIIRDNPDKFIVLQGVAGSGKTTIILHRLAYLLFTYPEKIKPEKSLIIAPNKMFLDYISNVLPALGIFGVDSNTYVFWAKKILKLSNKFTISQRKTSNEIKDYKGSIKYYKALEEFFINYSESFFDNISYSRKDLLDKALTEIRQRQLSIPLSEMAKLAKEKVFVTKKRSGNLIGGNTFNKYQTPEIEKLIEVYIKNNTDVLAMYKTFINTANIPNYVSKHTKKTLRRKSKGFITFDLEDLAPLVWLKLKTFGSTEHMMDYIVVDEAQDMDYLQLATLFMVSKKSNLLLAGDLAQAIFPPFNINSWLDVINFLSSFQDVKKYEYYQISKCYRTTYEIIEFANQSVHSLFSSSLQKPQAVLRHGKSVEVIAIDDNYVELLPLIKKSLNKYSTVAIIVKELESATHIKNIIIEDKVLNSYVSDSVSNSFATGLSILTTDKAKGLEFDMVFILDAEYDVYKSNNYDMRLFYVSATRALHELVVTYRRSRRVSVLLENIL